MFMYCMITPFESIGGFWWCFLLIKIHAYLDVFLRHFDKVQMVAPTGNSNKVKNLKSNVKKNIRRFGLVKKMFF